MQDHVRRILGQSSYRDRCGEDLTIGVGENAIVEIADSRSVGHVAHHDFREVRVVRIVRVVPTGASLTPGETGVAGHQLIDGQYRTGQQAVLSAVIARIRVVEVALFATVHNAVTTSGAIVAAAVVVDVVAVVAVLARVDVAVATVGLTERQRANDPRHGSRRLAGSIIGGQSLNCQRRLTGWNIQRARVQRQRDVIPLRSVDAGKRIDEVKGPASAERRANDVGPQDRVVQRSRADDAGGEHQQLGVAVEVRRGEVERLRHRGIQRSRKVDERQILPVTQLDAGGAGAVVDDGDDRGAIVGAIEARPGDLDGVRALGNEPQGRDVGAIGRAPRVDGVGEEQRRTTDQVAGDRYRSPFACQVQRVITVTHRGVKAVPVQQHLID